MCSWLFSGYHTARLLMSSGYEQEKYMYIHNKRGAGAGPTTSKQQKEKNQLLEHCRAPFFPTDCTRKSMTFLPHLLIFRKEILSFIIECEAQISSIHRGFIYYQGVWRRGQWSQLLRIYVDRSIVFYEKPASQNTSSEMGWVCSYVLRSDVK